MRDGEGAPGPPSEALLDLSRKYETIAALRRDREAGGAVAARAELRALAREFPGALRELDTVPLDEIDRRRHAFSEAGRTGRVEPWMTWMVAYHRTMRAALYIKAKLVRARTLSDDAAQALAGEASRRFGCALDGAFVRAVAAPPQGRINLGVFRQLAVEFEVPAETLWEALFPARRRGRY